MTWHQVPDTDAIFTQAALPDAALAGLPYVRGDGVIVVRNDFSTWRELRSRGLVVPPPLGAFRFAGRFQPRQHQRRGVEFLLSNVRCALLFPTGSGKTKTAAWAVDYLLQQGAVKRVLVVAPVSVAGHVWQREFFIEFPHIAAVLIAGDARKKSMIARDPTYQVHIINYESLHIVKDVPYDLIICDESTKVKSPGTKAWKMVNHLAEGKRLWLMTGTPTAQGPMDALGPIKLLRGAGSMTKTRWQMLTMRQITQFKWVPLPDADKTVATWLQPALRVRAEDCYDVPEVETIELEYDLTKAQSDLAQAFAADARAELSGKTITATNAAHVLTKLLQVQAGGVYGEEKTPHAVEAGPFFETLADLVESADTPVLIFASYRVNAAAIASHLMQSGLDTLLLTGDTPTAERSRMFDAVQRNAVRALVAVPSTMSHGITLTTSRYVVWATPPFSNETYQQSNARVIRQGQRNAVKIYRMVASKVTRSLFKRLDDKGELQDAVLEMIG